VLTQERYPQEHNIVLWPIQRIVEYQRNPRKNAGLVDRMCGSIREFGFKIPCLVRSDGEVVDGHLRLRGQRGSSASLKFRILYDEWTPHKSKRSGS
jgi:ParB-like nuclease domain